MRRERSRSSTPPLNFLRDASTLSDPSHLHIAVEVAALLVAVLFAVAGEVGMATRPAARSVYDVPAAFIGLSRCGHFHPLVAGAVAIHRVSERPTCHSAAFWGQASPLRF